MEMTEIKHKHTMCVINQYEKADDVVRSETQYITVRALAVI